MMPFTPNITEVRAAYVSHRRMINETPAQHYMGAAIPDYGSEFDRWVKSYEESFKAIDGSDIIDDATQVSTRHRIPFYVSFGASYRRTPLDYDEMGIQRKFPQHPVFPDRIDGRGYVLVWASSMGRARYLAREYFRNSYSSVYEDTSMWSAWDERSRQAGPASFKRVNDESLVLGVLTEDGIDWEARS
jgi:hypothetical protein